MTPGAVLLIITFCSSAYDYQYESTCPGPQIVIPVENCASMAELIKAQKVTRFHARCVGETEVK